MSDEPESTQNSSPMEIELYFLIAKFLSTGPCSRTAEVLREELKQHKLLPKRIDWEGQEHVRSFENLNETNRHISSNHLLKICQRIVPLLNRDVKPSVEGVMSLLGAGRQSILRTEEDVRVIRWPGSTFVARHHGHPLKPPDNLKFPPNLGPIVMNRQLLGCARFDHVLPGQLYSKMTLLSRSLGHLSAVYCVAFDRTGQYIFTGADDHLLKVWSAVNGRLLCTLRGHGAEITDITCSYDNTLLAAGSCDKLIRIWSLQTSAPVAVLHGHTHLITSLRFCPYPRGETRYLASTGGDGCLCIWEFNRITKTFNPKPIKFIERSRAGTQMLCLSFSPGGVFLATGSTDHVVRVYYFSGNIPEKICELEAHVDRIDSIQYANGDARFLSASKDGTARVWRFVRQEWKAVVIDASLKMSTNDESELRSSVKYRVTMACWSADDRYVITAVSDFTLKVWNSFTGELVQVLQGHGDEVFVLEHNPIDARILLSAGHDGNIIIWDMLSGVKIKTFYNMIEGQGHGAVFDCKWSPDGQSFAATDSHGFFLYFGFGSNDKYKRLPEEIFFHTDYRPLIRDGNNYVLDEQTQHPPHMMPPPFLVDIDGNPYPPKFQKFVPGREECQDLMLVPLVVTTANGDREVVDDLRGEMQAMAVEASDDQPPVEVNAVVEERPIIDEMIARMQHEQDQRLGEDQRIPEDGEPEHNRNHRAERRDGGRARRTRHSRDVDRMRQRHDDDNVIPQPGAPSNHCIWMKRDLVKEVERSVYVTFEKWRGAKAEEETKLYLHERRKKPLLPSELDSSDSGSYMRTRRHPKHCHGYSNRGNEETGRNRLVTRALYDTETEGSSATEDLSDHDKSTSVPIVDVEQPPTANAAAAFGTDSDSTEYSDWVPDDGATLQPPKRRSQRKRRRPRWRSPDEDSDEMGTDEEGEEEEEDDEEGEEEMEEEKKDERATPKKKALAKKKKKKRKSNERTKERQKVLDHRSEIREVPNEFRPPEWLTSAMPRKAPYFPQMGDEVIYFMQGHRQYIEAVKTNNTYQINPNKAQPWNKQPYLREQELMKVVGIKYEIKPPRLVCLKLAFIDPESSKLTGGTFTIKFHDMPGVIDFVILRQTYDIAMGRNWIVDDRFRCLIDDTWWFGIITAREPFHDEYPDSMFQCMVVHWDNGEQERLSPWDLEPLDRHRVPVSRDGSLPATAQELSAMSYRCKPSDWPSQGCDAECERIVRGLEQIMSLSIAEPFLVPVDLNAFPIYAMIIEYPIDLSTIKERLENRFYRRIAAIQYDVRQIEHNTRTFNEKNSNIVKFAKIVTELCLRLISDPSCYDVMALYNKLTKDSQFAVLSPTVRSEDGSSADESAHRTAREGTSSRRSVNQMLARSSKRRRRRQNSNMLDPNAWKQDCALLLETMLESDDSIPFRHAVEIDEFPDYLQVVTSPMDLATVRGRLTSGAYDTALEFCKDVRLVFKNSRSYNTNKRSRIYAMTLRLSAMFEDQFQGILTEYNSSNKHRKNPHRTSHRRFNHGATTSQSLRSSHPTFSNFTTPSNIDALPGETVVTSRRRNLPRIQGSSSCSNPRPAKRLRAVVSDSESELHPRGQTSTDFSQPSRRIKTRSKVPPKRLKYRGGADEEDDEEDEDGLQNHKSEEEEVEEEDDSDEDFQVRRRKKQPVKKSAKKPPKIKKSSSKQKLKMNGAKKSSTKSDRYGTRCATGSLKRKRYDRGFSDAEDEELSVDEASKETRPPNANGNRVRVPDPRALNAATSSDSSSDANSSSDDSESESHQSSSGTEEYTDQSGPTERPPPPRARNGESGKKLSRVQIADDSSQQSGESESAREKSARYSTRNQGRRTVRYQEDSDPDRGDAFLDHDLSDTDVERSVTVSSRGRIRRPNPRVRTSL